MCVIINPTFLLLDDYGFRRCTHFMMSCQGWYDTTRLKGVVPIELHVLCILLPY